MSQSEIARILQEIEQDYIAAKNGLTGFASGSARHQFITAKMEHLERNRKALSAFVGPDQAMELVAEVLEKI